MLALAGLPARHRVHHARSRPRIRPPRRSRPRSSAPTTTSSVSPSSPPASTWSPTSSRTCRSTRPGSSRRCGRCSRRPPRWRRRRTASRRSSCSRRSASRCRRTRRSIRSMRSPTRSRSIGTPAVLKTRRLGYDGKGQAVIHDAALAEDAWRSLGEVPVVPGGVRGVRPGALDRRRARPRRGVAAYPLVENHHRDGILRLTLAPAPGRHRRAADGGRTTRAHGDGLARLRRRAGDRAVPRGGAAARERDGAARAQQRPLDRRGRRDQPVREPPARVVRAAAGLDRTRRRERHGEPDRRGARSPGGRRRSPAPTCTTTARSRGPGRKLGHVTVRADDREALEPRLLRVQQLVEATA